jgi:hypothetical protein
MRPLLLAAGIVAAVVLASCTKTETTTTGATAAPPSTQAGAPSGPSSGSDDTEPATTEPDDSPGTTAPTGLGTWQTQQAEGPLAGDISQGGKALCSFSRRGDAWELRPPDPTNADYGSIGLEFNGSEDTAQLTLLGPGNKENIGSGTASVRKTAGEENIISFSINATYRFGDDELPGSFQSSGSCRQEQPRTATTR